MRCRAYWRDEVDGVEELAREPAMLPETWRQGRGQKVSWGTSHRCLNILHLQFRRFQGLTLPLNIAVTSLVPRAETTLCSEETEHTGR